MPLIMNNRDVHGRFSTRSCREAQKPESQAGVTPMGAVGAWPERMSNVKVSARGRASRIDAFRTEIWSRLHARCHVDIGFSLQAIRVTSLSNMRLLTILRKKRVGFAVYPASYRCRARASLVFPMCVRTNGRKA